MGYWNFPAAETDTSAYLLRIACLIPSIPEDEPIARPAASVRQLPAPLDGGQAGAVIFFSIRSVITNLFFLTITNLSFECQCIDHQTDAESGRPIKQYKTPWAFLLAVLEYFIK